MPRAAIRRRVQWFDTDTSSKEHNSAPLRWMEEAEAVLLDELGLVREVYGRLPRAHVTMDYRRPVRFWDTVEVTVDVAHVGTTSITYDFRVDTDGEVCVEGRVVAVLIDGAGRPREWPSAWRGALTGER